MGVTVRFLAADGSGVAAVAAAAGDTLLAVAQAAGQPLEGTCEGQMACSTCHVVVDPADFARLPPASEDEDDLLDLAAHVTRTSRLACQIVLTDALAEGCRGHAAAVKPGTGQAARRSRPRGASMAAPAAASSRSRSSVRSRTGASIRSPSRSVT